MRMRNKLSTFQTLVTQNPLGDADLLPSPASSGAICFCVLVCVNNTTYPSLVCPETVSTDGVSWQRQSYYVEVERERGKGILFRQSFLCLVPLVSVSVPVGAKIRWTLERRKNSRTLYKAHDVKEKMDSPGEVLYVHQHGILLHMQLISQQQQLHQLLIQAC